VQDDVVVVQVENVNWKLHEHGVNTLARDDPQALAAVKIL
jgi:hypothetical protein